MQQEMQNGAATVPLQGAPEIALGLCRFPLFHGRFAAPCQGRRVVGVGGQDGVESLASLPDRALQEPAARPGDLNFRPLRPRRAQALQERLGHRRGRGVEVQRRQAKANVGSAMRQFQRPLVIRHCSFRVLRPLQRQAVPVQGADVMRIAIQADLEIMQGRPVVHEVQFASAQRFQDQAGVRLVPIGGAAEVRAEFVHVPPLGAKATLPNAFPGSFRSVNVCTRRAEPPPSGNRPPSGRCGRLPDGSPRCRARRPGRPPCARGLRPENRLLALVRPHDTGKAPTGGGRQGRQRRPPASGTLQGEFGVACGCASSPSKRDTAGPPQRQIAAMEGGAANGKGDGRPPPPADAGGHPIE